MFVRDNIISVEGLGDFFRIIGEKGLKLTKKMAGNVFKKPWRASEIGANLAHDFLLEALKQLYHHCRKW